MNNKAYKNFLLINYGGIGDEILFLPVISALKKQYPDSKITLALEPRSKSIKDLTNDLDNLVLVDIKAGRFLKYFNLLKFIVKSWFKGYDCVISSGKSPFVAIILFLTGVKKRIGYNSKTDFLLSNSVQLNENQYAAKMYYDLVKPVCEIEYNDPEILTSADYKLNPQLKEKEFIALHPGVSKMSISKNILKCPKKNFWCDLIKGLLNKNKQVVLLGTKDDSDLIEEILKDKTIANNPNFINYYNKTKNIMEMAEIMKRADKVICVDSAPLHVAISVNADVFAVFAPTNEVKLTPKRNNVEVITNNIDCRPCLWHKRSQNCKESKCLEINPDLILNKIY